MKPRSGQELLRSFYGLLARRGVKWFRDEDFAGWDRLKRVLGSTDVRRDVRRSRVQRDLPQFASDPIERHRQLAVELRCVGRADVAFGVHQDDVGSHGADRAQDRDGGDRLDEREPAAGSPEMIVSAPHGVYSVSTLATVSVRATPLPSVQLTSTLMFMYPLPGVVISACRVIVVFLPLAFLGRWLFDLPGLFGATLVSNLVMGLAGFTWLGHQIRSSQARPA